MAGNGPSGRAIPASASERPAPPVGDLRPAARLPLLVLGMLSLLVGVLAGLARLGWTLPPLAAGAAGWHGALMVSAFFGTVISLERAVAVGRRWAYAGPAAAGLGGLALIAGAPPGVGQALSVLGAATLVMASLQVLRRQVATFTVILAIAALCWLVGNLAWWISGGIFAALPWWLAFLVLTIAGERLELTRFLPTPPRAKSLFLAIVAGLLAGAVVAFWRQGAGLALFSAGLLALAAWLARYDIARRNARQQGLTRFIALCLLSGYGWLAVAGLLGVQGALLPGAALRDAALHALGLGFVFSMVFGHAPIIFPAVTRLKIPYYPAFYLPLAALHLSLALRVAGGLSGAFPWRHAGGLANALALLLFIATMVTSGFRGRR
ncbi:MAG TPA: hypothetical protein VJ576_15680 [Rhodocyclaceae bacterium]|nr:hypothetical protein [Rhodocyclaceae bacterium]